MAIEAVFLLTGLLAAVFVLVKRRQNDLRAAKLRENQLTELMVQLEDERRNLEAIFDSTQVGLLLVDSDLAVQRLNQVALNMCGQNFFSDEDIRSGDTLSKTANMILTAGQPVRGAEVSRTIRKPDGSDEIVWIEVNASPLEIKGKPHILFSLDNITERKRKESEDARQKRELDVFLKSCVNREERILELKKEIETLKHQLAGH